MFQTQPHTSRSIWTILLFGPIALFILVAIPAGPVLAQERLNEGQRREVLQNLERGASALRVLGKNDMAERLVQIANELKQPAENRDRPDQRERTRNRDEGNSPANEGERAELPNAEREMAEQQLDVFRMAQQAFREKENGDAMGLVQRIIHGREMQLTGRRDEEAQQAVREIPGRGDQIELLSRAAEIWQGFGNEDKSQALASLADQMRQRDNRGSNADRTEAREQPAPDRETPNRDGQMEEIHQHLRRLSEQIGQLQKQLNELRDRR